MAEVTLSIAGRNYAISCRDGEEPHLRVLAERVDRKANEARGAVGDTSEPRLLLLAALLLADELHEAKAASGNTTETPSMRVTGLSTIADALERIAAKVES
jgi:cell division protein ZapA